MVKAFIVGSSSEVAHLAMMKRFLVAPVAAKDEPKAELPCGRSTCRNHASFCRVLPRRP